MHPAHNMRLSLAALATAAQLCTASVAQAQDAQALLGRWEPVMTSPNGVASILEFRPDGKFVVLAGTLARGIYTVDSVKITHSAPAGKQPLIRGYEVKGDTLTVWSSQHPTLTLLRTASSQSRSGLPGEWAMRAGELVVIETYRADGTWRRWTQHVADTSSYQVRRNFVTIRQGRMEGMLTWRLTEVGLDLQRASNARGSVPTLSYIRERQ